MKRNKSKRVENDRRNGNKIRRGVILRRAGLGLVGITFTAVAIFAAISVGKAAVPKKVALEYSGGPSLKVFQEALDLGDQELGQTVPLRFEIANVGDRPLRITEPPYLEVVKGCCPPTPKIGSMLLQPGETTVITFNLMMHGGMGGYHDLRLHLKTNDPEALDRTITILSNWI
jgi:hypothetical protein